MHEFMNHWRDVIDVVDMSNNKLFWLTMEVNVDDTVDLLIAAHTVLLVITIDTSQEVEDSEIGYAKLPYDDSPC